MERNNFEKYKNKENYDPEIVKIIENNFKRTKDLSEHVIMPDCYFKTFIMSYIPQIKENYENFKKIYNSVKIYVVCPKSQIKKFKNKLNFREIEWVKLFYLSNKPNQIN